MCLLPAIFNKHSRKNIQVINHVVLEALCVPVNKIHTLRWDDAMLFRVKFSIVDLWFWLLMERDVHERGLEISLEMPCDECIN